MPKNLRCQRSAGSVPDPSRWQRAGRDHSGLRCWRAMRQIQGGRTPVISHVPGAARRGLSAGRHVADRLRGVRRGTRAALAATVVLLAAAAAISAAGTSGNGGRALPLARGFSLPALGHPGQDISLAQYADRPVIVNFFASWCVPCRKETPLLARFYRTEHGRVPIIGIDANDQQRAALTFVSAAGVRY